MRLTLHGQRRAARGRRALGGRVAAVRAARAARAAGLQERVRAGRVRVVLGLPRRRRWSARAWSRRGRPRGATVVTVEGLAGDEDELHPIQEAFLEAGAVQCGFCTPGLIVATHDLLARNAAPERRGDPRGAGRQPVPLHGLREDPRRGAAGGGARMISRGLRRRDRRPGTVHARRARRRSRATGSPRSARATRPRARPRIDASGCLATPGLINCHHHLYQWATRGLAQQATLFEWLVELYPTWARIDARDRARGGAGGAGGAAAVGLHDRVRSPLRLPARRGRPAGGRDRGRARARHPLPPVPRRDGPRRLAAAGCRRTPSSRTATRSSPPTTTR